MSDQYILNQRVHIGNLPEAVRSDVLRRILPKTCKISQIEVRKNSLKFSGGNARVYAFVTVVGSQTEVDDWCNKVTMMRLKGLRLTVQKARPDFITRLRNEINSNNDGSTPCTGGEPQELNLNSSVRTTSNKIVFQDENTEQEIQPEHKEVSDESSNAVREAIDNDVQFPASSKSSSLGIPNSGDSEAIRLNSLDQKKESHYQQQETIKKALALDGDKPNKKIVFDEPGISETAVGEIIAPLFSDSEDPDYKYDFSANKPDYKIVQTSYSTCDDRFRLDHRFQEEQEKTIPDETSAYKTDDEAALAAKVLDEILGPSLLKRPRHSEPYEQFFTRFDPLIEDHEKYIVTPKETTENSNQVTTLEKEPVAISKDRFYLFSDDLSNILNDPTPESQSFSLLEMFGNSDPELISKYASDIEDDLPPLNTNVDDANFVDPSKIDTQVEESVMPLKDQEGPDIIEIGPETFFFNDNNDFRLRSSLRFFSTPIPLTEPIGERRKRLKKIINDKIKKYKNVAFAQKVRNKRHKSL